MTAGLGNWAADDWVFGVVFVLLAFLFLLVATDLVIGFVRVTSVASASQDRMETAGKVCIACVGAIAGLAGARGGWLRSDQPQFYLLTIEADSLRIDDMGLFRQGGAVVLDKSVAPFRKTDRLFANISGVRSRAWFRLLGDADRHHDAVAALRSCGWMLRESDPAAGVP